MLTPGTTANVDGTNYERLVEDADDMVFRPEMRRNQQFRSNTTLQVVYRQKKSSRL